MLLAYRTKGKEKWMLRFLRAIYTNGDHTVKEL
jgi:hypothetical protein